MPSDVKNSVRVAGVDFRALNENEINQLDFMARKLGCDRYMFVGYNYDEAIRWANSYGAVGEGDIRIGVNIADEIGARALFCVLVHYTFSDKLRKRVFELLNDYFTEKQIKENIGERER